MPAAREQEVRTTRKKRIVDADDEYRARLIEVYGEAKGSGV